MVPARQFRESADQCTRTDGPVPPPNYASNVVDLLATGRLLGSRRDRLLPPGIPVSVQKFSGLTYSDKDKYTKKISYSNTILTIQQAACFSMLRRGYSTPPASGHTLDGSSVVRKAGSSDLRSFLDFLDETSTSDINPRSVSLPFSFLLILKKQGFQSCQAFGF